MAKMKDLTKTKKNRIRKLRLEFMKEGIHISPFYCKLAYEELGFNAKKVNIKKLAIEKSEHIQIIEKVENNQIKLINKNEHTGKTISN